MLEKAKRYLISGSILYHIGKKITKFFTRLRRKADFMIGVMVRRIVYSHGEIVPNKIFVMTFENSFSCNAKYIVSEILKQKLPLDIVWVVPAKGEIQEDQFPDGIRLVRRGSYTMFEEQASAKIWIDNALNCVWYGMPKKDGQIYINTWHGSMGIKRLSGDRAWMHRAKRCNKLTDYCVTNSTFEENVFKDTFWRDIPVLKYGHARNDILFHSETDKRLRKQVCTFLNIENTENKRLFLYAPTFRDKKGEAYEPVDYHRLKTTLTERFGGEWLILVRSHFKDRTQKTTVKYNEWLIDASPYADMQQLLAIVDAGMTDYSSWAYDFVLTKRPLFLYAPDLENYDEARGFYYPLESTPFPLSKTNDEIESCILTFDFEKYRIAIEKFLNEKGCYEDGHASERVVEKLKELMNFEKYNGDECLIN